MIFYGTSVLACLAALGAGGLCRECARVMGFRDSFRFPPPERDGRHHHIYRQMGNAVVPPVIEAFARAMLCALEAAPRQPGASKPSVDG